MMASHPFDTWEKASVAGDRHKIRYFKKVNPFLPLLRSAGILIPGGNLKARPLPVKVWDILIDIFR